MNGCALSKLVKEGRNTAWVDKRGRGPKPDSGRCWDIFDSGVEIKVPFRVNDHNKEMIIRKWSWTRCVKVPDEMMINPLSPISLSPDDLTSGGSGHNTCTQYNIGHYGWYMYTVHISLCFEILYFSLLDATHFSFLSRLIKYMPLTPTSSWCSFLILRRLLFSLARRRLASYTTISDS